MESKSGAAITKQFAQGNGVYTTKFPPLNHFLWEIASDIGVDISFDYVFVFLEDDLKNYRPDYHGGKKESHVVYRAPWIDLDHVPWRLYKLKRELYFDLEGRWTKSPPQYPQV